MKKRLYIIFLIIALIFSLLTVTVNAADSEFKVTLDSSDTSVEKGEEVTVTLNVSDFEENVEKGINRVSGTLEIDDKAFEEVTSESIEGLNDWKVSYDSSTGKLECTKLKTITKGQDVCEITLEAKSSTTSTSGKIELSDLTASDSDVELSADDASLNLTIGSETTRRISSTNTNNTNTRLTRNISNTNTNTNTNTSDDEEDDENESNSSNNGVSNSRVSRYNTNTNNSNTNTNEENTSNNNSNRYNTNTNSQNISNESDESNEEEMPNTGLDDSIVKAILLISLIGIFGYIKIKSLDRK